MFDGDEEIRQAMRELDAREPARGNYASFGEWYRAHNSWFIQRRRLGDEWDRRELENGAKDFREVRLGFVDGGEVMAARLKKPLVEYSFLNNSFANPLAEELKEKPNRLIVVGSLKFCVIDGNEHEQFRADISAHNRWYFEAVRHGQAPYTTILTALPVTNPYERFWYASFSAGKAGWDVTPHSRGSMEEGAGTYHEKGAYVLAPTALLAIEKAKFILAGVKSR